MNKPITLTLPDTPEMRQALQHLAAGIRDDEMNVDPDADTPSLAVVEREIIRVLLWEPEVVAPARFDEATGDDETGWGVWHVRSTIEDGWCYGEPGSTGSGRFDGTRAQAEAFALVLAKRNETTYEARRLPPEFRKRTA